MGLMFFLDSYPLFSLAEDGQMADIFLHFAQLPRPNPLPERVASTTVDLEGSALSSTCLKYTRGGS
jgi:hypothetical protein